MTVTINGTTGYSGPVGTIGDLTTTGNTTLGDASSDTLTLNGNTASIPNGLNFTNGNIGVGVTPSAWASGYKAFQIGERGSVYYSGGYFGYTNNAYWNGSSNIYIQTGYASDYYTQAGSHVWRTAASGTAGNAITFTQAMTLNASGNLGVGTSSPSGRLHVEWSANNATAGMYLRNTSNGSSAYAGVYIGNDSSATDAFVGSLSSANTAYGGPRSFLIGSNSSTPFVFMTAGTERARIDSSGNLGLGTTSPSNYAGYGTLTLNGSTGGEIDFKAGNTLYADIYAASSGMYIRAQQSTPLMFWAGGSERARIDSSGNFQVGTTGTGNNAFFSNTAQGTRAFQVATSQYGGQNIVQLYGVTSEAGINAGGTAMGVSKNGGTNRSINAAGTINASGADYAEYMMKAGDFNVAKGDVVGINAEGRLTNVFADAVSFAVKSTDPSYVGGDSWGVGFENDAEGLEAARQKVDRIAFSGQVPVNVTGATPGQFIIPVNDNGGIAGQAVSNPTFEQYQQAVGKVIAIEQDGRARIIVKVA